MENISLTRKPVIHRKPEPPPDLAEFEANIMTSDAAFVSDVDRAFMRALLRYVRRLERDVAEMGEFWWFAFCNGCPSVFQTLRQPGTNSSRGNWQQAAFAAVVHPHQHAHAAHPSYQIAIAGGAGHVAPSTSGFRC